MYNLSEYLNKNELISLGKYALFIIRNVYRKRRTAKGTFTVDLNTFHMQKMIELINILDWFVIEIREDEFKSIKKSLKRLNNKKFSISASYLKSLVNDNPPD
jgi:hypothetical protein